MWAVLLVRCTTNDLTRPSQLARNLAPDFLYYLSGVLTTITFRSDGLWGATNSFFPDTDVTRLLP
jgi:hypothetical protein